jgi:hypothetical protein
MELVSNMTIKKQLNMPSRSTDIPVRGDVKSLMVWNQVLYHPWVLHVGPTPTPGFFRPTELGVANVDPAKPSDPIRQKNLGIIMKRRIWFDTFCGVKQRVDCAHCNSFWIQVPTVLIFQGMAKWFVWKSSLLFPSIFVDGIPRSHLLMF